MSDDRREGNYHNPDCVNVALGVFYLLCTLILATCAGLWSWLT